MSDQIETTPVDSDYEIPTQKAKPYYVSNKRLYQDMIPYIQACDRAKAAGTPLPQIPPYVAESIMKIANKYANKPNFIGYSYREEMIGDAIITCCKGIHNFDIKYDNPFAYITQACKNAFLRRIELEQKETSIKAKYITENFDSDFFDSQEFDDNEEFRNNYVDFMKDNAVYTDRIREKKEKKAKEKREINALEALLDEESAGDESDA